MDQEIKEKAQRYCEAKGYQLREQLGFGIHGGVWVVDTSGFPGQFALKVFQHEVFHRRERDAYLRLRERGVTRICGCDVPILIDSDDEAWVILMTVVERPFVLDFAGSRLDTPEDFPEPILREFLAEKEDQFGADWPKAKEIVAELETYGIYLTDISPSNISVHAAG